MTDPTTALFVALPVLLVIALASGVWIAWRRDGGSQAAAFRAAAVWTLVSAGWMTLTWQVAASGAFRRWDMVPPPLMLLVLGIVLLALRLTFSSTGRRLATHIPLWALVGVQAFRLPLEMAMHEMHERGVMPRQMSYSGLNFDIVTGVTALIVALLLVTGRASARLALAWNILGTLLLANIVVVAILSTPLFGYFGPNRLNVWVTYPPYVWLPAVMVLAALAGHLIVFRALRLSAFRPRGSRGG